MAKPCNEQPRQPLGPTEPSAPPQFLKGENEHDRTLKAIKWMEDNLSSIRLPSTTLLSKTAHVSREFLTKHGYNKAVSELKKKQRIARTAGQMIDPAAQVKHKDPLKAQLVATQAALQSQMIQTDEWRAQYQDERRLRRRLRNRLDRATQHIERVEEQLRQAMDELRRLAPASNVLQFPLPARPQLDPNADDVGDESMPGEKADGE